jgi:hypothetical protein
LFDSHYFKTPISFAYTGGCNGYGASCNNANCPVSDAFHKTDDYAAQRQCTSGDVSLFLFNSPSLIVLANFILSVWSYHLLLLNVALSIFITTVFITGVPLGFCGKTKME